MKIAEEEMSALGRLTDLSNVQRGNLLHAIYLAGYFAGEASGALKVTEALGEVIGTLYLAENDKYAHELRKVYQEGRQRVSRAQHDQELNQRWDEEARRKIGELFAVARKIVVQWERS